MSGTSISTHSNNYLVMWCSGIASRHSPDTPQPPTMMNHVTGMQRKQTQRCSFFLVHPGGKSAWDNCFEPCMAPAHRQNPKCVALCITVLLVRRHKPPRRQTRRFLGKLLRVLCVEWIESPKCPHCWLPSPLQSHPTPAYDPFGATSRGRATMGESEEFFVGVTWDSRLSRRTQKWEGYQPVLQLVDGK